MDLPDVNRWFAQLSRVFQEKRGIMDARPSRNIPKKERIPQFHYRAY